jgi:hypothetical protein
MFKLPTGDQTFISKVQFQTPTDRGTYAQHQFKAKFKRLRVSELQEITKQNDDVLLLKEVFIGFDDVEGTDGKPCKFSLEARDLLLDDVIIMAALRDTYLREMQGGGRRKN